jgi:hypothetical protein
MPPPRWRWLGWFGWWWLVVVVVVVVVGLEGGKGGGGGMKATSHDRRGHSFVCPFMCSFIQSSIHPSKQGKTATPAHPPTHPHAPQVSLRIRGGRGGQGLEQGVVAPRWEEEEEAERGGKAETRERLHRVLVQRRDEVPDLWV